MDLFRGLRELGWVDGKNMAVEYRWASGRQDRLSALAADLVRLKVDVIVTASTPAALAAKQATTTIPIVVTFVADPVGSGIVTSLARPGGNITGVTDNTADLMGKYLELLTQMVSRADRIAVLWDPAGLPESTSRNMREVLEVGARALGAQLVFMDIRRSDDLEEAFSAMMKARVSALLVAPMVILFEARTRIIQHAAQSRVPTMYPWREAVEAGGLVSYATDLHDMYRRAAVYLDKILRGVKPADLPVEQPTKYELIINLKTAKTLGLEVPPTLLARADEVIE
jgi:putative ABC transport system substrate-binding protein